jgi:hypothetical protein
MSSFSSDAFAETPARVEVDPKLAFRFQRQFYGCVGAPVGWLLGLMGAGTELSRLQEHARNGDCQPAVVIALNPVVVAAYADELDDVALLRFNEPFIAKLGLTVGTCLISANAYFDQTGRTHANDIMKGERSHGRYVNFHPVILNFITRNGNLLEQLRAQIPQEAWERAYELGAKKLAAHPHLLRYGSPFRAMESIRRG